MKKYKYKEYKEKNTADAPKLSKRVKRALEGSNRVKAKREIAEDLSQLEELEDDWEEIEMRMADLCWQAQKLVGEGYVCTCPGGGELALQHIEKLERFINERILKQS